VYGSNIAAEIKNALITIDLTVPGTIKSVKGGTFANNRAAFSIPLIDFLVLEKPVSYDVVWNK
jgi:hypothetical protein